MTLRRFPPAAPEVVTLATQDEHDRIAMVIMQLEMALALARTKGLAQLASHLEAAIDEARSLHDRLLN
jgi:predicted DCC family thiol-disulfide oxidoreductase YuxK